MRHWIRRNVMVVFLIAITPFVASANMFVTVSSFVSGVTEIANQMPQFLKTLGDFKGEYQRTTFYRDLKDLHTKLYELERLRDEYLELARNGEDLRPIQNQFVEKLEQVKKNFNAIGAEIARTSEDEEKPIRIGFSYKKTTAANGYGVDPDFADPQEREKANEECREALEKARRAVNKVLKQMEKPL